LLRLLLQALIDGGQGIGAVMARFTATQQIEVWAVKHQQFGHVVILFRPDEDWFFTVPGRFVLFFQIRALGKGVILQ
jgi:hypothetical protein